MRGQARAIEFVLATALVVTLILAYEYFATPLLYSPGAEPYDLENMAGDILDRLQENPGLSDILNQLYWGDRDWAQDQLVKTLSTLLPAGVGATMTISRYVEDPVTGNKYFTDTIVIEVGSPPPDRDVEKGSAKAIYTGRGLNIYLLVLTLYRTV